MTDMEAVLDKLRDMASAVEGEFRHRGNATQSAVHWAIAEAFRSLEGHLRNRTEVSASVRAGGCPQCVVPVSDEDAREAERLAEWCDVQATYRREASQRSGESSVRKFNDAQAEQFAATAARLRKGAAR